MGLSEPLKPRWQMGGATDEGAEPPKPMWQMGGATWLHKEVSDRHYFMPSMDDDDVNPVKWSSV